MTGEFRQYLYPPDHPRPAGVRGLDAYAYRDVAHTPDTFTVTWSPVGLPCTSTSFVG